MAQTRSSSASGNAFLRVERGKGYAPQAVTDFLLRARASFDSGDGSVTASTVRAVSFPLTRRGFDIPAVDQALIRLEDAFAFRERENAIAARGIDAWLADAREQSRVILARLERKPGHRFARTSVLAFGYRVAEVDAVCERIARFLREGQDLDAAQVRRLAFRMQRGGYREEQVDALLDAVTDVILAVR